MNVFISYKSEEFAKANALREQLEENGISCWMAPMSITGGASYAGEIPKAIRECTVFLLLLSQAAQRSQWISRELDQAINHKKVIMPFKIDDAPLVDEFTFYLANVQWYDAVRDEKAAFDKLLCDIHALIPRQPPSEETPPETTAQPSLPTEKASPCEESPVTSETPNTTDTPKTKTSSAKPTKKRKAGRIIGCILGGAVALVAVIIGAISLLGYTTVAGERFSRSEYSIELHDKVLTQKDVENLNSIEDLSRLTLVNCDLSACQIDLLDLSELYELCLDNCGMASFKLNAMDWSKAEDLAVLSLANNSSVVSLTALTPVLDTLYSLDVRNTGVETLTFDERLENLEYLHIDRTAITSLEGLESAMHLKWLTAGENALMSLKGLENTSLLEVVDLHDNQIEDVSVLMRSKETLQFVYLANNPVKSIAALSGCSKLKVLNIDGTEVTTLKSLSDCTGLEKLSAVSCPLILADGLKNAKLSFLDLSGTNVLISEQTPIGLGEYTANINLSGCMVENLAWTSGCDINRLILSDATQWRAKDLKDTTVYSLAVSYSSAKDPEVFADLNNVHVYMIDCPDGQRVSMEKAFESYSSFVTFDDGTAVEELWKEVDRTNLDYYVIY